MGNVFEDNISSDHTIAGVTKWCFFGICGYTTRDIRGTATVGILINEIIDTMAELLQKRYRNIGGGKI